MFGFAQANFYRVASGLNRRHRASAEQVRHAPLVHFLAIHNKLLAWMREPCVLPVCRSVNSTRVSMFYAKFVGVFLLGVGVTQESFYLAVSLQISETLPDKMALAIFRQHIGHHEANQFSTRLWCIVRRHKNRACSRITCFVAEDSGPYKHVLHLGRKAVTDDSTFRARPRIVIQHDKFSDCVNAARSELDI